MKKITSFFVLCLSLFLLISCSEDTTTTEITTTQNEPTTTFVTTDNIYEELIMLVNEFFSLEETYDGVVYFSSLDTTMYSGSEVMESIVYSVEVSRDLINPYIYTTITSNQIEVEGMAVEYFDNQILQYYESEGLIYTEVVERTAQDQDFNEYVGDQTSMVYDAIFPGFGNYYKVTDTHYQAYIDLGVMLRSNSLFVEEGLNLEGLSANLEEVYMAVNYIFDENSLTINIEIDRFAFITGSNVYAVINMTNVMTYQEDFTRVEVDYVNKYVTGPNLLDFGIFTFHEDIQERLYLYPERNNYFRFYFEAGTYNISDSEYIFSIYVYDDNFIEIEGTDEYVIPESGYYYVNIYNAQLSEIYIEPDIYKLD